MGYGYEVEHYSRWRNVSQVTWPVMTLIKSHIWINYELILVYLAMNLHVYIIYKA